MMAKEKNDLLLPDWGKLLCFLVVACESMYPALDQDQAELGVLVLPVPLQMLPNRDRLLDEMVQILGDFRSKA